MNLKLFFCCCFFLSVSGYAQFQEREDQNLQTFHKGTEIKREDAVSLWFLSISTQKLCLIFTFSKSDTQICFKKCIKLIFTMSCLTVKQKRSLLTLHSHGIDSLPSYVSKNNKKYKCNVVMFLFDE